jgi:flagellar L-ring protein FlgH
MTKLIPFILLLVSIVAHAQTQPRETAAPPNTTQAAPRIPQPTLPMDAASVEARRQASRGSLLQSTAAPVPPGGNVNPFSFYDVPPPEPKIIQKHDLVQIIVREESESKHEGTSDLKKEAALQARIDEWIKFNLHRLALSGGGINNPPSINMSGGWEYKGEGTNERTDSLTARVQAEVIDVKPNGTLILQARKTLKTDDDEVKLILSGVCRVEDVTADNTVLSTQLYDLELQKVTKGAVTQSTKRGWLPKLLDFVNPF